ncbi:MAG: type I-B CRISPR-associated protein Cas7/Csh2 [Deltaproteobacteria bacterium]|nr:type I-B CRISPR-associated protein Cas7/Csh2 [Deltaproteobacteria bacterium]
MTDLTNKSELLFLYDIKDANPNGDPLDENKPRIDEETGQNIVTDVRLKRTIRDYLFACKGYNGKNDNKDDIFVREIADDEGKIQDGKARARDFDGFKDTVLERCIDIRLFGATIPKEKDSITLTGPVQFKMGRSLHPVVMKHIRGTGAFAAHEGKKGFAFREEDILYYSLIAFHGIINPTAAKESNASEEDIKLLLEGMWEGTKNLISRSKFGQMPRLLLKVNYNSPLFFIGDLDRLITYKSDMPFERLRDARDLAVDTSRLNAALEAKAGTISSIEYIIDSSLELYADGTKVGISDLGKGIQKNEIVFEL